MATARNITESVMTEKEALDTLLAEARKGQDAYERGEFYTLKESMKVLGKKHGTKINNI